MNVIHLVYLLHTALISTPIQIRVIEVNGAIEFRDGIYQLTALSLAPNVLEFPSNRGKGRSRNKGREKCDY